MSTTLFILGVLAIALGALIALAGLISGSGYNESADATAVALGVGAAIQGLLLIGFAKALSYLKATAYILAEEVARTD